MDPDHTNGQIDDDATDDAADDAKDVLPIVETACDDDGVIAGPDLAGRIEALLISTDRPLSTGRLAELTSGDAGAVNAAVVEETIESLNDAYDETGRSFIIERLAGGWQVLTRSAFGPTLAHLHQDRHRARLSPAALETLAIIAYRQPLIRAEIEAIRGVACGEVLRGLLERRLVRIAGRAEMLGRPMLYGTTREFLNVFGLAGLDDLPEVEGLQRQASMPPTRTGDQPGKDASPDADETNGQGSDADLFSGQPDDAAASESAESAESAESEASEASEDGVQIEVDITNDTLPTGGGSASGPA